MRRPDGPLAYFEGFLDFLAAHRDTIEVITYADLDWRAGDRYEDGYAAEWARWRKRTRHSKKIYVILQHDVDSWAERSMAVAQLEAERGLRSNLMIFNRCHRRWTLREQGVLEFIPYDVDVELLRRLEREHGFVIGYHCNALEQALWDDRAARRRFRDDVRALRKHYDVRFFSAHGGVPSPDGRNNTSIVPPWPLRRRMRWVATGHSIRITAQYSDGGLLTRGSLEGLDLRDFVRTWVPGGRYRVLTHPQYYCASADPGPMRASVDWYMDIFGRTAEELWRGVTTR